MWDLLSDKFPRNICKGIYDGYVVNISVPKLTMNLQNNLPPFIANHRLYLLGICNFCKSIAILR